MTSEGRGGAAVLLGVMLGAASLAQAAETPYPFEGTWVRAERACLATTVRSRTFTAHEVVSPRGRCAIHRVAAGSNSFELLEECRRNDRPFTITETVRLLGPDTMTSRRQESRLKIARLIRYQRCTAASPGAPHSTKGPQATEPHPAADPRPAPDAKPHS